MLVSLLVVAISCGLLPLRCSAAQERAGGGHKRYGGGYGHKHHFKTDLSLDPERIMLRCKVKEPLEHIIWVVSRCPGHQGGYGSHPDRLVAEGATVNDPMNYDVRVVGANSTITSDLLIKNPLSSTGSGVYRCEAWPHGGGGPPYGYVAQEVYIIGGKELLKSCFGGWEAPSDFSGGYPSFAKSKHRGGDGYPVYFSNMTGASSAHVEQIAHGPSMEQNSEPHHRTPADPMSRLPIYPSRPGRYPIHRPDYTAQESREQPYNYQENQGNSQQEQRRNTEQQKRREQPYSQVNSHEQRHPYGQNNPREQPYNQVNHHEQRQPYGQNNLREQPYHQANSHEQRQPYGQSSMREQPYNQANSHELQREKSEQQQQNSQADVSKRQPKPVQVPADSPKPMLVFASSQPTLQQQQSNTPAPSSQQSDELQSLLRRYQSYLSQQRQIKNAHTAAQSAATTQPTLETVPPRSYVAMQKGEAPIRPSPADPGTPPAWSQLVARVQSRSSRATFGAGHSGNVEHLVVDTATQKPEELEKQ